MKKVLLLCLLTVASMADSWDYLVYITGMEFKNKEMVSVSIINNNGYKASVGTNKKSNIANAEMLKKFSNYKYKEAYEMDVLATLGKKGWELVNIMGEPNSSNKRYYFKKER